MGVDMQGIESDIHGIIPEKLSAYLSQWPKPSDGKPSNGKLKVSSAWKIVLFLIFRTCSPTLLFIYVKY